MYMTIIAYRLRRIIPTTYQQTKKMYITEIVTLYYAEIVTMRRTKRIVPASKRTYQGYSHAFKMAISNLISKLSDIKQFAIEYLR